MKRYTLLALAFALTWIFLSACATPKGFYRDPENDQLVNIKDPPVGVLTFHYKLKYPRGTDDEMFIEDALGEKIWVLKNPLFHTSVVFNIFPVETSVDSNYFDLRLKVTPRGERWWNNMIDDYYQRTIVIAIDGKKIGEFIAEEASEIDDDELSKETPFLEKPGWIRVPGPFHTTLVEKICSNARRNFIYYLAEEEESLRKAEEGIESTDEDEYYKGLPKSNEQKMEDMKKEQGKDVFDFGNIFDSDLELF